MHIDDCASYSIPMKVEEINSVLQDSSNSTFVPPLAVQHSSKSTFSVLAVVATELDEPSFNNSSNDFVHSLNPLANVTNVNMTLSSSIEKRPSARHKSRLTVSVRGVEVDPTTSPVERE